MDDAPLWLGSFSFGNVGFRHLHSTSALGLRPLTQCFCFKASATYIGLRLQGFGYSHSFFALGLRQLTQCFRFRASATYTMLQH